MILLSAGVGATPVLSMLHSLADAGSTRPVWWLHGARDGSEHPFAAESRALLDQLPHSQSHVFYQPADAFGPAGDRLHEHGRLSIEALRGSTCRATRTRICADPWRSWRSSAPAS